MLTNDPSSYTIESPSKATGLHWWTKSQRPSNVHYLQDIRLLPPCHLNCNLQEPPLYEVVYIYYPPKSNTRPLSTEDLKVFIGENVRHWARRAHRSERAHLGFNHHFLQDGPCHCLVAPLPCPCLEQLECPIIGKLVQMHLCTEQTNWLWGCQ